MASPLFIGTVFPRRFRLTPAAERSVSGETEFRGGANSILLTPGQANCANVPEVILRNAQNIRNALVQPANPVAAAAIDRPRKPAMTVSKIMGKRYTGPPKAERKQAPPGEQRRRSINIG